MEILANCDLRHPKVCRYMKKYKLCKHSDFCSYDHEVGDTTVNRSVVEIDDLRKTMDEVKDIVEQQKLIINTLQLQVANLEIAHLNKNETVENEFNSDNDDLEIAEESLHDESSNNSSKVSFDEENDYSCAKCDYSSKTEAGAKIHIGKKHKPKGQVAPLKNVHYEHFRISMKLNKPECYSIVRKDSKPSDSVVLLHSGQCWESEKTRCDELRKSPPINKDIPVKDNLGLLHIRSMVGYDLDCWRK